MGRPQTVYDCKETVCTVETAKGPRTTPLALRQASQPPPFQQQPTVEAGAAQGDVCSLQPLIHSDVQPTVTLPRDVPMRGRPPGP